MILVDTNVISEAMRPHGDPRVRNWLDRQPAEGLFLSATSLAETLVGVESLPDGKRKQSLVEAIERLRGHLFSSRLLPFDEQAAGEYAVLVARARRSGRIISISDGQIAAIAAVRRFTVATRDTAPFRAAGVPVVNPWES